MKGLISITLSLIHNHLGEEVFIDIKVTQKIPARGSNAVLVLSVQDGEYSPSFTLADDATKAINQVTKRGNLPNTEHKTLTLYDVPGIAVSRILLQRSGKPSRIRPAASVVAHASAIADAIRHSPCENVVLAVDEGFCPAALTLENYAKIFTTALASKQYTFNLHKQIKPITESALKTITFIVNKDHSSAVKRGANAGAAIAHGMNLTKDLGNLAPNICTPEYLAKQARTLGKGDPNMKISVLDEKQMEKLGMDAFLSVSRGSRQPGRLIAMDYRGGKKNQKPIVLVGKGVTFDTGGISIKPSAGMDEMKYDMCGAATVFGVMQACQTLNLKLNVVGVVAAAENMPDGDASRPGDVVTTMSGQSVEILNTDAEGRLVLCDTLTWVEKYKPKAVVDMATLTGACIVALGHVCSAVLGNDDELIDELYDAGQQSADTTWRLPLWDDYQKQLDSNFADMANIGGSAAGTITAACFLSRFTENYPWAHLDIAGIAWDSGPQKGATGRPVSMLMHWLLSQSK